MQQVMQVVQQFAREMPLSEEHMTAMKSLLTRAQVCLHPDNNQLVRFKFAIGMLCMHSDNHVEVRK